MLLISGPEVKVGQDLREAREEPCEHAVAAGFPGQTGPQGRSPLDWVGERYRGRADRLAEALDSAGDAVWEWDLAAAQLHLSARWKAIVGCDDRELLGRRPATWFDRVHPEDLDALRADIGAHLDGNASHFANEHRLRRADGSYVWVLARGLARRDRAGMAPRLTGTLTDLSRWKSSEEGLAPQALHNVLTGLPNRAAFLERLARSLRRANRARSYRFALLFLDIDRFKLANESLGHISGDQVVVAISQRLAASVAPGDVVAHLGGDEFAILVDHILDDCDAIHAANRVREDLAEPFSLGNQQVYVTASIGIALSTKGYDRPEDMLRDADATSCRAKAFGRGSCETFDPLLQERALARLRLEAELRRAVERKEFRVYYQPIVALPSGEIACFEALLRWQHPERGLLTPAAFLSTAEETGLLVPMAAMVLREACRTVRGWQAKRGGSRPLAVSMNLNSTSFAQSDVVGMVERVLEETGFSGSDLGLEISEDVVMPDSESVLSSLLALKKLRVEIHLDDFGTGYSSLSYLHRLPTDALKIDRSFVAQIDCHKERVIVQAIVELAHNLGQRVIAEGVETPAQLNVLRELKCEYAQGYYFAEPLDEEAAERLLLSPPLWNT
jgi:diguanylate cyclase (GGDEF)-like protein/PAS domain S-box-containing protein